MTINDRLFVTALISLNLGLQADFSNQAFANCLVFSVAAFLVAILFREEVMAIKWTELEGDYVFRQFKMFDHIPSWETVASNVNRWVRQDNGLSNNRSASACRHKYYELKRKEILNSINDLPQEEKYRLIYKVLNMEGIR